MPTQPRRPPLPLPSLILVADFNFVRSIYKAKQPRYVAAFTLLELIVTLVIIGVLAAAAAPIFLSPQSFASNAARDEMLSALRHAQQRAMADSTKTVRFITTATSYSITVDTTPILQPDFKSNYPQNFTNNVTVSPATTLNYAALGTTTATTFTFSGGERICVESTGYAYAC